MILPFRRSVLTQAFASSDTHSHTFQNCFDASLPPTLFNIFAPPGCSSTKPRISYTLLSTMMYRPLSTVLCSPTSFVVNSLDMADIYGGGTLLDGLQGRPARNRYPTVVLIKKEMLSLSVIRATITRRSVCVGRPGKKQPRLLHKAKSMGSRTKPFRTVKP